MLRGSCPLICPEDLFPPTAPPGGIQDSPFTSTAAEACLKQCKVYKKNCNPLKSPDVQNLLDLTIFDPQGGVDVIERNFMHGDLQCAEAEIRMFWLCLQLKTYPKRFRVGCARKTIMRSVRVFESRLPTTRVALGRMPFLLRLRSIPKFRYF